MTTRMKLAIAVAVLLCVFSGGIALLLIKTPAKKHPLVKLEMRVFKFDPVMYTGLERVVHFDFADTNHTDREVSATFQKFFKSARVDLTEPGRSVAFNRRLNLLFVKATTRELDTVERTIQALYQIPPQINIKTRFINVPENEVDSVLRAGTVVDTKEKNTVEIVTADKTRTLLREMQSSSGVMTLSEPETVTTSGRQTQMRSDNSTIDLHPWLLSDGYTFCLDATVSKPETLTALANIWDGQTLALVSPNSNGKNRLVVFITATVVDPTGNRVYSENKLPFKSSTIPPQPKLPTSSQ